MSVPERLNLCYKEVCAQFAQLYSQEERNEINTPKADHVLDLGYPDGPRPARSVRPGVPCPVRVLAGARRRRAARRRAARQGTVSRSRELFPTTSC